MTGDWLPYAGAALAAIGLVLRGMRLARRLRSLIRRRPSARRLDDS